jgi:hypothetical protein
LGPIPAALQDAEKKCDNRSPFLPQQKSVSEGLPALNFLVMPGTAKDIVNNGLEQADVSTDRHRPPLRSFISFHQPNYCFVCCCIVLLD